MGLGNVVKSLSEIAQGAGAVSNIHDTGKHFADMYGDKIKKALNPVSQKLTINAYTTDAPLDKGVTFYGTGTGIISLYSGTGKNMKKEREIVADKEGKWYARLYFTVPGKYIITAKDYHSEESIAIQIS